MFNPIEINRNKLTIMGVQFANLKILESMANVIGSNMFEGFESSSNGAIISRDL